MKPYKFLLDRDVSKTIELFPRRRARTVKDIGLPDNATDASIVERAWDLERTIVTSNGDDFLKEMRIFLRQAKRKDCHDLFGLVILPNRFEIQRRAMTDLDSRMRFEGKQIGWADVWWENLCVRVQATGVPQVVQLPRCFYCQRRKNRAG